MIIWPNVINVIKYVLKEVDTETILIDLYQIDTNLFIL